MGNLDFFGFLIVSSVLSGVKFAFFLRAEPTLSGFAFFATTDYDYFRPVSTCFWTYFDTGLSTSGCCLRIALSFSIMICMNVCCSSIIRSFLRMRFFVSSFFFSSCLNFLEAKKMEIRRSGTYSCCSLICSAIRSFLSCSSFCYCSKRVRWKRLPDRSGLFECVRLNIDFYVWMYSSMVGKSFCRPFTKDRNLLWELDRSSYL